ncbi:BnaC02g47030D [Brassica napus]|uniref:BnaC02g47030D protein n=2 Tax=Brassica TaxID=3705 RepID=A0A078IVF2_BRANA|nr:BnaC02g47030D [Brassica napus]
MLNQIIEQHGYSF